MGMRAAWSGNIIFGMVTVPIRLYASSDNRDVQFHQVHAADGGRIQYKRVCAECHEEVDWSDIRKGWSEDLTVTVTDEELRKINDVERTDLLVEAWVDSGDVDPLWVETSYYCAPPDPKKGSATTYSLLLYALRTTSAAAVVRLTFKEGSRPSLAVIAPKDDVLQLHILKWADELRPTGELPRISEVKEPAAKALDAAVQLIRSQMEPFQHEAFTDDHREAVTALLRSKQNGGVEPVADTPSGDVEVDDLLAALEASRKRA